MNPADVIEAPRSSSHFVVKRGHHGRYRFAMMTANGRIKGEVQVEIIGDDRTASQAQALAKISCVADEISAAIAFKIAAASLDEAGATSKKGEHRGQI